MKDYQSHNVLPTGKLPLEMLQSLLQGWGVSDSRVIVGPRVGEDAAVIAMGDDRCLVAKSDPITFATERIGWYAVHVNANDIATRGAEPRWFLLTVLLPEGSATLALAEEIMAQVSAACTGLGIALVGGHTEVTCGLERPIVVGHMLGEVARERLVTTAGACPGDVIVLAGAIAVEGTALLARECGEQARQRGVDPATLEAARRTLDEPGISIVHAARLAVETVTVHAMHDPTEGGLAMGLHELAWAASLGLEVDGDAIPILPACARLCAAFGLNPLGLLASGALLLAVPGEEVAALGRAYDREGIVWAPIARALPDGGVVLRCQGMCQDLPRFDRDEVTRVLGSCAEER